jgi:hypothetical protein
MGKLELKLWLLRSVPLWRVAIARSGRDAGSGIRSITKCENQRQLLQQNAENYRGSPVYDSVPSAPDSSSCNQHLA